MFVNDRRDGLTKMGLGTLIQCEDRIENDADDQKGHLFDNIFQPRPDGTSSSCERRKESQIQLTLILVWTAILTGWMVLLCDQFRTPHPWA
jgi:hypothetical protein